MIKLKFVICLFLLIVPALGQFQITSPPAGTISGSATFTAASAPVGTATVDYWIAAHSIVSTRIPSAAPFSAIVDTTLQLDGPQQVIAVARDSGGNILGNSAPVLYIINNVGFTTMSLAAPNVANPLSGTVTFTTNAADTRGIQAYGYALDGSMGGSNFHFNGGASDNYTLDTTTLANGPHYFSVNITPNAPNGGDPNSTYASAQLSVQFTVANAVAPVALRTNYRNVYFHVGQTAPVQLSASLLNNDGSAGAQAATYSSDNPNSASVDGNGLIAPGGTQGVANITVTGGGKSTIVRVVNITTTAGFPHFTKAGGIISTYTPTSSLWVRTLFNTPTQDLFSGFGLDPNFAASAHKAGINVLTSAFYRNPSDYGTPDYATFLSRDASYQQSQLDALVANNFSMIGQGDPIQRSSGEMNFTVNAAGVCSFCAQAVQYTMNQLAVTGRVISVEMQDEVGGTPVPANFRTVMSIINGGPRPKVAWPAAGVQGPATTAAWEGDPTVSDYGSLYYTFLGLPRPAFGSHWSLQDLNFELAPTVSQKFPAMQIDKPAFLETFVNDVGYQKMTPGDSFHQGVDVIGLPGVTVEEVTAQPFYAAALGFAGVRVYGFDGFNANNANDSGWYSYRNTATLNNGFVQQVGASPTGIHPTVVDKWNALSNAFTLMQTLEPYLLSPQVNAIDLGVNVVTGARQLATNNGRLLIAVNMLDNAQTVSVNLAPYRYPNATMTMRYRLAGLLSTSEMVPNDVSQNVTIGPGETMLWLFTPQAGGPSGAPAVKVQITSATPTQAVIHVSALNSDGTFFAGPCTYRASEGFTFTSLVNDVNPALFAGSNADTRPGATINGKDRYFVLGTRAAQSGTDGYFYSRALQADTQHWVGVTCGGNAEQTVTFKTQNPPLGNSYPEFPNFDPLAFGNRAEPTIDFTDKTKTYIDPQSGFLLKRISSPLDYSTGDQHQSFAFARDLTGSAWSNSQNALTNQQSGSLASTSTPNAGLFLSWQGLSGDGYVLNGIDYSENFMDLRPTPSDLMLRVYGSGTGGAVLGSCITVDSGATCASGEVDITLPPATGEADAPSNYPSPMFKGWGVQHQPLNKQLLSNLPQFTVSVTGSIVTGPSGQNFIVERRPGSKILIPGSAPACANNVCTIQSVDTPQQMTIQENLATPLTGVTAQDYGAGVLVWLKNTGTSPSASVSFTYDHTTSWQFVGASNAEFDTCSIQPINDISTDRLGNPISPPLSGYLCSLGQSTLILWIPSTGESRLMSSYYQQGVGRMLVSTTPFSATDAKTLFATNIGSGHLYKATLNNSPGNYAEYVPGITGVPAFDNLIWTDLTIASTPIDQQVAAIGGPSAAAYTTGIFPPFHFVGIVGGIAVYDTATTGDGPCIKARALADTNQIIQLFDSWEKYPLRWGGCHSSPTGISSLLSLSLNPIQKFSTSAALGGPFTLNVTQLKRGGVWQTYTTPIAGANNANPVVFTAPSHGIDAILTTNIGSTGPGKGPQITISGGTGNWAAVNGVWTAGVTPTTPDTFTIAVDTRNFGPLTGSLTFTGTPPLIHSFVNFNSADTPATVTISSQLWIEPSNHRFQDGDAIGFSAASPNQQYYAKVSGYSITTFGLYADHALTQPVSGVGINLSGYVYLAETCPAGLPPIVTSAMQFDTGPFGVRCITVRVNGEPCSAFATPLEHATYPCKADPSNTAKSSLQDIQVGDAIRDLARSVYDETFVLVKKVKNSENDIELTFMRWYGNEIGGDNHTSNAGSNGHDVAWTPFLVPSNSHAAATGWMDALDPTTTFLSADPNYALAHGDTAWGNAPGLFTFAGGAADSISNKTIKDLLATPLTHTKKENPPWAGSPSTQLDYGSYIQSYPGHRQFGAPPVEHRWKGDWAAMNSGFGNDQTAGLGLIAGSGLATIRGTPFDPGSSTAHVFKINNPVGPYDRKRTPTYAWGGKFMFADKSGPGSLITDADIWKYCVADNAGECRPGSAKNDTFLAATNVTVTNGYCETNTLNFTVPCFIGANPLGGWATQVEIDPVDSTARRIRRLTLGFTAPGMHWTFMTWLQTPGGKWGFFSAPFVNGLRNDYFAIKLPPWPAEEQPRDSTNRATFIPHPVTVTALSGAPYARARFGYAENGPPSSFFCTTRQEACSTEIPGTSSTDPYSFVSEIPAHMSCATGCIVTIPTVPGRVVYYVIDRLDPAGNVISTSPLQVAAKP